MEKAFGIVALLLGLSALFGYVNHTVIRLPHTIGLLVIALLASVLVVAVDAVTPAYGIARQFEAFIGGIDFYDTLMRGMLAFLLFAGALHVDLGAMMSRRYAIALMATLGVLISTFLIGTGFYYLVQVLGLQVPYLVCLVLGAVISPTDPVAVLSVLKIVRVPQSLKAKIAGESLFNDGVGVVVFTIVAALAFRSGVEAEVTASRVVLLFLTEAVGGAALGLACGWLVQRAMRTIDDYVVEILMTLALVSLTYWGAGQLHVSGLIAVVVAGLLMGNEGAKLAMSKKTREHVHNFWELIDEILNSVLFLLIGFEVLLVRFELTLVTAAALSVPLVLVARLAAVAAPLGLLRPWRKFTEGGVWVLTWGGLRGGISVALALSLPESPHRDLILTVTYVVMIFSVVAQGLTIEWVIRHVVPGAEKPLKRLA